MVFQNIINALGDSATDTPHASSYSFLHILRQLIKLLHCHFEAELRILARDRLSPILLQATKKS